MGRLLASERHLKLREQHILFQDSLVTLYMFFVCVYDMKVCKCLNMSHLRLLQFKIVAMHTYIYIYTCFHTGVYVCIYIYTHVCVHKSFIAFARLRCLSFTVLLGFPFSVCVVHRGVLKVSQRKSGDPGCNCSSEPRRYARNLRQCMSTMCSRVTSTCRTRRHPRA